MRLANKIALITGGGSGIGAATAKLFASQGASVALADIDEQGGQAVVTEIRQSLGEALFHLCDISQEQQVKQWIETVAQTWGGVDILVNNAATFVFGNVEEVSGEDWDKILSVNVKGYAFCAKYAAPLMRQRGGGSIVNLGSISSVIAQKSFVPYNTSKGAILQMTRCLAYDLAPDNIRVNCVCPGTIDTPAIWRDAGSKNLTQEEFIEQAAQQHLLGRIGQPIEVAHAILFLASSEASFITGTSLMVDGGYTAQ
ncbi:short-chain dehydrogenase/reductase SDR (plasmid) [Gloeothece citriformis PCC 7424]|uniref:Short-chain dehydrogenase/reductase SDR n=1 Tax=Gloeothece citriformis (strain PCC 7424) TaxID=65393 RepID=B7KMT1_GLOC7|nr:SDR family oxidoreductase [Gloeothece citriformis]ACK74103.1 short-chain dehydrogenase/reductase SDR [Gloeothece citriformis PCC 7424]